MTTVDELIELPSEEMMGPAMLKLNERQRRFVCALAVYGGNQAEAYLWAGYEAKNMRVASAAAARLHTSALVVEAIKEEAWRRLDSSSLLGVSTLVELASQTNEDKKTRIAAANSLLDRVKGFAGKSESTIIVRDERTTAELIAIIREHAPKAGLDANQLLGLSGPKVEQPVVIDAEFEEVDDFLAGCV